LAKANKVRSKVIQCNWGPIQCETQL